MRIRVNQDHQPRPSMTPVIDVVFNLLIFFLLASQFARAERDQAVSVPQVSFVQAVAQLPRSLIVNIAADGGYTVMNIKYELDGLDGLLERASADNPDQQVILRGDAAARLAAQAAVLDLCNKHQIRNIGITLAEKPKEAP